MPMAALERLALPWIASLRVVLRLCVWRRRGSVRASSSIRSRCC